MEQRKRKERQRQRKTIPTGLFLILAVIAMFSDPIASFRLTLSILTGLGVLVFLLRREAIFFVINTISFVLLFFPIAAATVFFPAPVERDNIVIMQQTMETFSGDFERTREEIIKNKANIAVFSIGNLEENMLVLMMDGVYANKYMFENERVGKVFIFMDQTPEIVKTLTIDDETKIGMDFSFKKEGQKYHVLITKMPSLMEKGGYQTTKISIEKLMEYIHVQDTPFILAGDFTLPSYTRVMKPVRKEGFMTLLSPKLKLSYRLSAGETYVHPGFKLAKVRRGIRVGENLPKISVINFNFETGEKEDTLAGSKNEEGKKE